MYFRWPLEMTIGGYEVGSAEYMRNWAFGEVSKTPRHRYDQEFRRFSDGRQVERDRRKPRPEPDEPSESISEEQP
jgi:hypothetical protein